MQHTRRDSNVQILGNGLLGGGKRVQETFTRQAARIIMHLQTANAGGNIHDARQILGAKLRFQGMNAQAQGQIQHVRPEFDQ